MPLGYFQGSCPLFLPRKQSVTPKVFTWFSCYGYPLLNSLCGCRWDEGCVQHIAHICEEIPMSSEELEFLIEKILRCRGHGVMGSGFTVTGGAG